MAGPVDHLQTVGEISTIADRRVAAIRLRLDAPASAYFFNAEAGLRVDLLFDFPIAAATLAEQATRIKIRTQVFDVASEQDLLRLKRIATAARSVAGDVEDIAFLEAQALEPLRAVDEMRGGTYPEDRAIAAVISRVSAIAEYRRLFAGAFGGNGPVNEPNLGRALAAFQRTLVAANTPFDRYMRGETTALGPEQVRGMERFQSAGCINCHSGPMFSDFAAHVLAVPDNGKLPESDSGVNKTYAFRTPSLRNLSSTAPYMHNGLFATLPEVIDFYERISRGGGRRGDRGDRGDRGARGVNPQVSRDQIDPLARRLNMRGRGQRDLLAFLRALDDSTFDRTIPDRVPSGLAVGGRLQP